MLSTGPSARLIHPNPLVTMFYASGASRSYRLAFYDYDMPDVVTFGRQARVFEYLGFVFNQRGYAHNCREVLIP